MLSFRGLDAVRFSSPDGQSSAQVLLHGATLVSYVVRGRELLFVSSKAVFDGKKAIRGGVPLCFPLFGPPSAQHYKLTQHGFARTSLWSVVSSDASSVALELRSSDATRALWPFEFRVVFTASLSNTALLTRFETENTGANPFDFSFCFHAYFAVTSLTTTRIAGLGGLKFIDNARNRVVCDQVDADVRVTAKIDNIYVGAPSRVRLHDGESVVTVESVGTNNLIVWNPGAEDAAKLADLGDGEFEQFVCVEPAHTVPNPFHLCAGQRVATEHTISLA